MDLPAPITVRAQFAVTISLQILFPAFSIGLNSYLALLNGVWPWIRTHVQVVRLIRICDVSA